MRFLIKCKIYFMMLWYMYEHFVVIGKLTTRYDNDKAILRVLERWTSFKLYVLEKPIEDWIKKQSLRTGKTVEDIKKEIYNDAK